MNTYQQLRDAQVEWASSPEYANDDGSRNVVALFARADQMPAEAQAVLARLYSLDYALDGQVWVGSARLAAVPGPEHTLLTAALAVGLPCVVGRQVVYPSQEAK